MKVEWEGRVCEFDSIELRLSQWDQIAAFTGHTSPKAWEEATLNRDDPAFPRSATAALWLMLAQNGEDVKLAELDPPYQKFWVALVSAVTAEAEAAKAAADADPTKAAAGSGGKSARATAGSAG